MLRPWDLKITLDRAAPLSVQAQIVHAITREIHRGRLRPGTALPGSRELAATLAVHRKTVVLAYDELVAQGWLVAEGKRGTFVSPVLPPLPPAAEAAAPPRTARPPPARDVIDFKDGVPDSRLIRFGDLSRAFRHALLGTRGNRLGYADPRGMPPLRRALAAMLSMERGLAVDEDSLCVVRGSQMGSFLAARLLLRPGDPGVTARLSYPPARAVFRAGGAQVATVDTDRDGLRTDQLEALCRDRPVRAVYVTPHHHYPTTVMMAAERRLNLLRLAEQHGFAVIEDDYDHEFHYTGTPVMPLASLDRGGRVVYVGSLSKVLAPGLRVGYLAAAPDLIDALDRLPVDQRPQGVMASVRPTELLVAGPGEAEPTAIPIDGDAFYLSFAPWVTGTHECYFHSLTTCLGELGGEEITVTITSADGDVLVDETTTTFANGFVGYWLPRDIEATLEVTYGDLSGTAEIGTGPDDATCVTTLRMLA